jgi:hypothetical protein
MTETKKAKKERTMRVLRPGDSGFDEALRNGNCVSGADVEVEMGRIKADKTPWPDEPESETGGKGLSSGQS